MTDAPIMPYEHIVGIANERVVTADDFRPFVGHRNWAVIDGEDLPVCDRTYHPNTAHDGEGGYIAEQAICEIVIRQILNNNRVGIVLHTAAYPNGWLMHIDADELAIRIEAS